MINRKMLKGFSAALILAGVLMLAGCARSDSSNSGAASSGTSAGTSSSGSASASSGQSGAGSQAGDAGAAPVDQLPDAPDTYDVANQSGEEKPAADPEQTYDALNQTGEENAPSSDWDGTYANGSGTLTLTTQDASSLAFSFSASGISGTAYLSGSTTAQYSGDDNHSVTFVLSGSSVNVTVTDDETGAEASDSPVAGTYTKQ